MRNKPIQWPVIILVLGILFGACNIPKLQTKKEKNNLPPQYYGMQDTANSARFGWRLFFTDSNLITLIDSALANNQEYNITLQEIEIARNEVRAKKGAYLPFVNAMGNAGTDKPGRYTSRGSSEANTQIEPGKNTPDLLSNYMLGAYATWEVDIWKKLRNARKSAFNRYMATTEGKNFLQTNLVSEIARSYFELLALDNQLVIIKQNIDIQTNALEIVKLQKQATRVTELAVRRFEAQVLKTRSLQFDIQQQITVTENRLNFLVGRVPQAIPRSTQTFTSIKTDSVMAGIPTQLLENRPDIRKAEFELAAAKLDIKSAKAAFYPSLGLSAGVGFQAYQLQLLLKSPESMLLSLAGDIAAPMVNRNGLKADYFISNARQSQAVYNYERTVLNAYIEVVNQISNIQNLNKSYALREAQVQALTESIEISNNLFRSARADYMEVLLTQRDALESKFELIETKKQQLNAMVNMYRALGGGWF